MNKLSQWFASFLKKLFFKNVKGENRLIFIMTGLFFMVIVHFIFSASLFFRLHAAIINADKALEADLKLANSIKNDLADLSSEVSFSIPTFTQLVNKVNMLSAETRADPSWKVVEASVTNLVKIASDSENRPHHSGIDDAFSKSKVLINELARTLVIKRQKVNDKLLSKGIIYETSSIAIIFILLCFGVFFLTKSLKKQQLEMAYFESLAYQFRGGQLDKIQFNYRGKSLITFNQVISSYIQHLKERYQAVKEEIKKINFQINEISLFSKQSNSFYTQIKQGLEKLIEETYYQVDRYQVIAEGIKSLDFQLEDSQQRISILHESIKGKAKVFQETPEELEELETSLRKREQYLATVVGAFNQLGETLERLLQTGAVFQNVAEQNTLLALNASIEAARGENTGGSFEIAAEEIANLAAKTGQVSKELMAVVDKTGAEGNAALKTLEGNLAYNNEVRRFLEGVTNKIKLFCSKLNRLLEETIQYSIQVEELEDKCRALEQLTVSLGSINQRSHYNFGRAQAALEVIKKSGETLTVTGQLDSLITELKYLMNKIAI